MITRGCKGLVSEDMQMQISVEMEIASIAQ